MSITSSSLRRAPFNISRSIPARAAGAAIQPYSDKHNNLTDKWLARLRVSSTNYTSNENFGQLHSLIDYFNKETRNRGLDKIDWKYWEGEIHTQGVVKNIRRKYNRFMKSEYYVEDAASRVDTKTKKFEGLDVAMNYNYVLWLTHYSNHMQFMEGITNLGDITDMSEKEALKYAKNIDVLHQSSLEIGDLSHEDYNEVTVASRIVSQFSWGSRYMPPFVHSSDALNAVAATLGKLGK